MKANSFILSSAPKEVEQTFDRHLEANDYLGNDTALPHNNQNSLLPTALALSDDANWQARRIHVNALK